MKTIFKILFFIYLVLVTQLWSQSKSNQIGQHIPRLKFDVEQFDFGEIDEGQLVNHIYRFRNTGNDTLRITRINPG